jgi:hypothetical protein
MQTTSTTIGPVMVPAFNMPFTTALDPPIVNTFKTKDLAAIVIDILDAQSIIQLGRTCKAF